MNDRLMIAAMAMQGMYTNERYNSISFADTANEALKQADALLAAAGEKEKPQEAGCACRWRNGEDKPYTRCGLHQGWFEVIAEWAERAKAAESKLAACERERDQGKENLFTAECRLLDREKQIADLKRRMEPLTRDELIEDGAARKDWLGMTVTQTLALVNQADRIRARRA